MTKLQSVLQSVPAMPAIPTTKFNIGQRAFARMVDVPVTKAPDNAVEADLVGDLFASLYRGAERAENVPAERAINAGLLDWVRETAAWGAVEQSAAFNLPAALTASNMLYEFASTDEAMKECLDKQSKAAEAKQQADAAEMLANAMQQENLPDADKQAQKAQKLRGKADASQAEAQAAMEAAQGSAMTKGLLTKAVQEAAEAAKEMAAITGGFGRAAGGLSKSDAAAAQDLMKRLNAKIRQIAKLAGRLRGVALSSRSSRTSEGIKPVGYQYTQDPAQILPTELALLSPAAGPLRFVQAVKFADYGLLGLKRAGMKPHAGPFVAAVDVSGSMGGQHEVNAKSLALGLAQVAQSEGRAYRLFSFSSAHDDLIECDSTQDWQAHLAWAEDFIGGGTDFDRAILDAMGRLDAMGPEGERSDLVFISDGDATVEPATVTAWQAFQARTGARLLYVAVHHSAYDHLRRLADKVIDVANLDALTADQLARDIGAWAQ